MKVGDIVEVKPLSKKMKDRVNSHGRRMTIKAMGPAQIDGVIYSYLLESLELTFRCGDHKTTWAGWVAGNGKDCELIPVEDVNV